MPNYIDKNRLLKIIAERNTNTCNESVTCLQMKRIVENIPAEDVRDVKHGHWIPSRDGVCPIRCSECNTPALWVHGEDDFGYAERRYSSNFCPYCGARMDGDIK